MNPTTSNAAGTPVTGEEKRFQCSICGEPSARICTICTKDACDNHLCGRCQCCSDCCECEQR